MSAYGCTCTAILNGKGIVCERHYHRDPLGLLRGKCTALVDGIGYVEWDDDDRTPVPVSTAEESR